MERTADLSPGALAVELVGLVERCRVYGNRRMQLVVVGRNALEVLRNQLPRGHALLLESLLHLRNGGFHDVELAGAPLALCRWSGYAGQGQQEQKKSHIDGL